jgi:hypothetical protein
MFQDDKKKLPYWKWGWRHRDKLQPVMSFHKCVCAFEPLPFFKFSHAKIKKKMKNEKFDFWNIKSNKQSVEIFPVKDKNMIFYQSCHNGDWKIIAIIISIKY